MNPLTLTFLGTGTSQGVPPIGCDHPVCLSEDEKDKRLRVSVAVSFLGKNLIVDCGPDFRQQLLRENINQVSAILFTHEHNDHVSGLDDIRPLVFRQKTDMNIYSDDKTLKALSVRFPYIFDESWDYPGIPKVKPHLINGKGFQIADFQILPIKVLHGVLPIWGYKFNDKIAYITDAKTIPSEEFKKLNNLDILVINALRKEKAHHSHFLLEEALEAIKKINPKRAYITHISHEMGFHDEVQKELPKNVYLAYDGLKITC